MDEVLVFFGLSCGMLGAMAAGFYLLSTLAVHVGTSLAGLERSLGRAVLVLPVTVLFSLPLAIPYAMIGTGLSERTQALGTTLVTLAAQTLAIRWLYETDLPRALLGHLLAAILTLGTLVVVMLLVL